MATQAPQLSIQTLEFNRSTTSNPTKQPLYRPAALRRNHSSSSVPQHHPPSPSLSPALAPDQKANWLAAPWSNAEPRLDAAKGALLPKSSWIADIDSIACADAGCGVVFSVIARKHHCRKCGQTFCSTHSSRTQLLQPTYAEAARSPHSSLDLPARAHSYFSQITLPTSRPSTPSSSPPRSSPLSPFGTPGLPVASRVCDTCYFDVTVPSSSAVNTNATMPYAKPLPFRHHSRVSTPISTPQQSPSTTSAHSEIYTVRGKSPRSRHGSASTMSSSDPASTPPTSFGTSSADGLGSQHRSSRGVSPAGSVRNAKFMPEQLDEEEEAEHDDRIADEEADREIERRENEPAFGSVGGEWSWQSWATF